MLPLPLSMLHRSVRDHYSADTTVTGAQHTLAATLFTNVAANVVVVVAVRLYLSHNSVSAELYLPRVEVDLLGPVFLWLVNSVCGTLVEVAPSGAVGASKNHSLSPPRAPSRRAPLRRAPLRRVPLQRAPLQRQQRRQKQPQQ